MIYPEGRLNPGYEKLKAKSGAVRISLASGVPIIPLGIFVRSENIKNLRGFLNGRFSKGCWQVSGICHLHFGTPWIPRFSEQQHLVEIHQLSQKLMKLIYSLVHDMRKELACESPTSLNPIPQW